MKKTILKIKENLSDFAEGFFKEQAAGILEKEIEDFNDMFMILCFGDLLGIPTPASYYTLELLPYFIGEIDRWESRINRRSKVFSERCARYDFCC